MDERQILASCLLLDAANVITWQQLILMQYTRGAKYFIWDNAATAATCLRCGVIFNPLNPGGQCSGHKMFDFSLSGR